jgi:hypothetical protein
MESKLHIADNGQHIYRNSIGAIHREDGPALIFHKNGHESWWLYNKVYHNAKDMPLNLFLAYVKWEYRKHGN